MVPSNVFRLLKFGTLAFFCYGTSAVGLDLEYTKYYCTQKCGLTPNTPDTVSGQALSEYDAKDIMWDTCNWKGMSLQGEANCTQQRYDFSRNEGAVRCDRGVGARSCRVDFSGRGKGPNNTVIFKSSTKVSNDSFAVAYSDAQEECREKFRSIGIYSYRCDLSWYAPN